MRKPNSFRASLLVASAFVGVAMLPGVAVAGSAPPAPKPAPDAKPVPTADHPVVAIVDNIDPQWAKIQAFWAKIQAFSSASATNAAYSGDLTAFWGNLQSFGTTDPTMLTPAWAKIQAFSTDIGNSWNGIQTYWSGLPSYQSAPQGYATLAGKMSAMVAQSQSMFGPAVQAQTGKSFADGFANPLLAKYGINLSNPQTLANLDPDTRAHFFVDWWDSLMNYSGRDHVDHWMNEVNWSPALTQQVGMTGTSDKIGILDFSLTGDVTKNVISYSGVSTFSNGHGSAVASLIVSPWDGKGVMGIAPSAQVIAYNPYDASETASWSDITAGVAMLTKSGATTVNASLGVSGWTLNSGWDGVFNDPTVSKTAAKQIFVIAAGNDGMAQTQNVTWHPTNPQIVVVGSVDPTGKISSFSNQPGTVCLGDDKGNCGKDADLLMNHFIVAPGELMLVSDGQGGVTRYSGTSFAAPLVSGTIALIQDRWPWLDQHPKDVVNIIFKSAKDLGAPGIDPVYGNGELDVQAALSPLDWSKLQVKQVVNGVVTPISLSRFQTISSATRSTWQANNVYFSLFEDTGESTRDFQVPLSTNLANQTVGTGGSAQQFMSYLTSRFTSWIGAPTTLANGTPVAAKFTDLRGVSSRLAGFGDTEATLTMRPRVNQVGFRNSQVPFESSLRLASTERGLNFEVGNGSDGAAALGGQKGFAMTSDYDPATGGANPFLGFASGGAYSRLEMRLAPGVSVAGGVSNRTLRRDTTGLPLEAKRILGGAQAYQASAASLAVALQPSSRLRATVGYAMLHENDAVLGMGSANPNDMPLGSTTDSATAGADWSLTHGLSLSASASVGRTRAGDATRSPLAVGANGLTSSSFQVAMAKQGLLDGHDRLRVTFAQPMHVESGSVDVSMLEVVDRSTGALGLVTQQAGITTPQRRYVAEMLYGRDLMGGAAQLSVFGRANINAQASDQLPGVTGGTSFRLAF